MFDRAIPASLLTLAMVVLLTAGPTPVRAQQPAGQVEADLAMLRAELAALRAEVDALRTTLAAAVQPRGPVQAPEPGLEHEPSAPPSIAEQVPPVETRLRLMQAQVGELAQVKVESASRFPVKVFGAIHTHAFLNTGEANWLDVPNIVPALPADGRTGTFSSAMRQTRLGLTADGPTFGGVRTSAVAALDFLGGIPGFQTGQVMGLPRILVAFARFDGERTAMVAGQDHMVLAPRDPSSLAAMSFPGLFRSGNLYLRAPQVTVERALSSTVRVAGGIMAPIAGDFIGDTFLFVPPALAGERSRLPAFQGRLAYASGATDARRVVGIGLSGHYGRERHATHSARSWAAALDFGARRDWIGMAGELFTGEQLDAFGGGTGLDGRAAGGWAELQIFPADRLRLHAGVGVDSLRHTPLAVPRRRNANAYGNVMFALTPEVEASLEYWSLETIPGSGSPRRNHHVDWVLVYRF